MCTVQMGMLMMQSSCTHRSTSNHLVHFYLTFYTSSAKSSLSFLATPVMEDFKSVQLTSEHKSIPKYTLAAAKEDHKSLKVGRQCLVILAAVIATIAVLVIVGMLILIIITFNTNVTLVKNINELEHKVMRSSEELNALKPQVTQSANEAQTEINGLEQRLLDKINLLEES